MYKITVERIEKIQTINPDRYDSEKRETIYEQKVEEIDLISIINAVNKIKS